MFDFLSTATMDNPLFLWLSPTLAVTRHPTALFPAFPLHKLRSVPICWWSYARYGWFLFVSNIRPWYTRYDIVYSYIPWYIRLLYCFMYSYNSIIRTGMMQTSSNLRSTNGHWISKRANGKKTEIPVSSGALGPVSFRFAHSRITTFKTVDSGRNKNEI